MQDLVKIHQAFNHIRYFDKDHTYYDISTGEQLVSCTSFIKKFEQPFQKDFFLKKKSQEYGITPQELEEQWDKQRIVGSSRGTIIHKFLENLWFGKDYPVEYPKYIQNLNSLDFINYHKSLEVLRQYAEQFVNDNPYLFPVRLELVIGDSELGIAGTMDGLFWDDIESCFAQIDIKTDKKIDVHNQYQNYRKPITKLSQCNLNKYQLQLSIYQYVFEKNTGLEIGYSKVLWMNHKNDNYEIIPVNYLKNEVQSLFEYTSKQYV